MLTRKLALFAVLFAAPAAADVLDIFSSDRLTDGSRFAFAPSKVDNTIIAVDVQEHEVAAVLEVPRPAGSVIATNELSLLVATHPDNESVTVINLYNREIIRELDIGMRPDAVLANTYDRFVTFGSRDGSVSTWDLSNFEQIVRVEHSVSMVVTCSLSNLPQSASALSIWRSGKRCPTSTLVGMLMPMQTLAPCRARPTATQAMSP
jgi:WD40 repeat protein